MIINLINDDIEFELNWVIFELFLAEFQQTLLMKTVLDNHKNAELWVCDRDFCVITAEI